MFRFTAPIAVATDGGSFVRLPLPASTYAHALQPGLRDLRIVDAHGERVPFAMLDASESRVVETQHDAVLYPLPTQRAADGTPLSPLDVTVDGDRVRVTRATTMVEGSAPRHSPGWLFDLGERRPADPTPRSLRLAWSGPAEFSAPFRIEVSDDLRQWRPAGRGQVMALESAHGALTQPSVVLPPAPGRFVRLQWDDAHGAPALSGAAVLAATTVDTPADAASRLVVAPVPAPGKPAEGTARALYFDLGAALPLASVGLQFGPGTHIAPARLEGRQDADAVWHAVGAAAFYQIVNNGTATTSPPLPLATDAPLRYLRLLPDERAAALDPTDTKLVVAAPLASLVFAAQGTPPFRLLAGARNASAGALPLTTLVPALAEERTRFGRATLGDWTEVAAVAQQAQTEERHAAWRPRVLWGVLIAGVAGLGVMVWRLVGENRPRPRDDV